MTDPRLEEALHLLDPPAGERLWYGGATALGSLRGVTAEMAAWKPSQERHSIWELALHVAYWKYAVRRRLDASVPRGSFPRGPANWPAVPEDRSPKSWKLDRQLLASENEALLGIAQALGPRQVEHRGGKGDYRNVDLLFGVATHDIYHTGQIQLMKRLYKEHGRDVTF